MSEQAPPTRDSLIEAAKRAAAENGGVLSRTVFRRATGISDHHVYRVFPDGGYTALWTAAGLGRHPMHNEPVHNEELLADFHRVVAEVGRVPPWPVLAARSKFSDDTFKKHFGGKDALLREYREWLSAREPGSPILQTLPKPSAAADEAPDRDRPGEIQHPPGHEYARGAGPEYGGPIDFRGLRHAPINEQGVVFLFGMVARDLGFIVEAVHAAFPDCEAKRCVDRKKDRWQRVRIEFEFRSRNFQEHGHAVSGCDLVVCWTHDWPECPLEVIELRKVIDDLDAKPGGGR
ncbi:MAG: hypothetical protein L0216_00070 [Planctomycetales bacterium]|nr:hypothetical protein [Planctomycetales bacterium]